LGFLPAFAAAVSTAAATAIAATATATTTTAAVTAASTAAATTTAATLARFHRARFVDGKRTSAKIGAVQFGNSLLRGFLVVHFDEPETLAAARIAIGNYLRARYLAVRCKHLCQLSIVRLIRKPTYVYPHVLTSMIAHAKYKWKRNVTLRDAETGGKADEKNVG
jgi:hypothetical protein